MIIQKINNLSKRHKMPSLKALTYETFVQLYKIPLGRNILRPFIKNKSPSRVDFVLGCYNAGTTVVKNAIALHPDITTAPVESDLLTNSLNTYEDGEWPRCMVAKCHDILDDRKHGKVRKNSFISDLRPWISNDQIFLEKSISNTCRVPLLRSSFSNSKFICVTRQPEGIIRGIQKRSKPTSKAKKLLGDDNYPYQLLLRQWIFFYSLIIQDYNADSKDIYICSYEKFINEPEQELKKIFDFLNLDSNSLTYIENKLTLSSQELEIRPRNFDENIFIDDIEKLNTSIELSMETLKELNA